MRARGLVIAGLAVLLVAAVYANSWHNGFHFDDGHSIQDNTYLRALEHIPTYFTDVRSFSPLAENRSYRPLLLVGYALSHALGDGAAWAYHLGSLVLHAFGAWLVGMLALCLLGPTPTRSTTVGAMIAAGLFATHPLLSETVNYLSARSSMQGAVLAFAAVLLYVRGRQSGRAGWIAAGAAVLAIGMLSKLTAITTPALLVAWELLLGPDRDRLREVPARAWLMRIGPYAAVAGGVAVLHEVMIGAYARGARSMITPWSHLLTQTQVWMRYQALYIWPEDLCADLTMRWSESPLEGPTARSILFVLALVVLSWRLRKRLPVTVFGLFWFYVTLSPTNSFVPLSEPATEHRVYIAAPGLIWATIELAMLAVRGARARVALVVAAALLLIALGARTHVRNRVWKDDVSLWGSVLECAPDNGRAHLNYGRGLLARGDTDGARQSFARCASLWPGYAFCPINQAALAWREGDIPAADGYASRAIQLAPGNVYARYWRGRIDLTLERFEAAARHFAGTLEISPGFDDGARGLALARFELGELEAAEARLRPFAARGALGPGGWFAWGFLRDRAGDAAGALQAYDRCLTQDPQHHRARYNRGVLHHRAGQLEAALRDYRVLAAQPQPSADVLFNLAVAEHAAGHAAAAVRARGRLQAQAPDYAGLPQLDQALGIP